MAFLLSNTNQIEITNRNLPVFIFYLLCIRQTTSHFIMASSLTLCYMSIWMVYCLIYGSIATTMTMCGAYRDASTCQGNCCQLISNSPIKSCVKPGQPCSVSSVQCCGYKDEISMCDLRQKGSVGKCCIRHNQMGCSTNNDCCDESDECDKNGIIGICVNNAKDSKSNIDKTVNNVDKEHEEDKQNDIKITANVLPKSIVA